MRLLIAGDTCPTEKNEELFEKGDAEHLFGQGVLEMFQRADFKLANIEGVFSDVGNPIDKSGPAIKTSEKSITGLLPLGLDVVSLANNHSLDYGVEGLKQTVKTFKRYRIPSFGYGYTAEEARKPFIQEVNGVKIGVYACAETEFTIVSEKRAGVNPFDELEICDDIQTLNDKVDYLIVLYHGMKEQYRYPAPYVQKRCRKLIDKGADLVLCQHSHCIGCMENYRNGVIIYGQGDFIFCRERNEYRENGLLVSVDFPEREIKFWPIVQNNDRVHLASKSESESILKEFYDRSYEIKDPELLQKKYDEFCNQLIHVYDENSLGIVGKILRRLKLSGFIPQLYRKKNDLAQLNALQCEAHRDVYMNGLKQRIENE